MIYRLFILVFLSLSNQIWSQSSHELLMDGDKNYIQENYTTAEEFYRKAKDSDNSLKSNFNLGNAIYKQERFEEAIDHYQGAVNRAKNNEERSNAYFNLGNAYYNNQKIEESIEAYKNALKNNLNNKEAKYNLAAAKETMKMIKMQEQQQQQQQNSDQQNEENKDQDQQNNDQQQNSDQQNEENQQQDQQQNQQEEKKDSSIQNQSSSFDSSRLEKQQLDSTDAKKLLQIIQSEELKVQEKLRKFNSNRKKPKKDW